MKEQNLDTVRSGLLKLLTKKGIKRARYARMRGIDPASLYRFFKGSGLSGENLLVVLGDIGNPDGLTPPSRPKRARAA